MTLAELNALDREGFLKAVGWVFEDSPWIAERAWLRRPFSSLDYLHAVMTAELNEATAAAQQAVLRAHPDLGTRLTMTAASSSEQTAAGLDRLSAGEAARLNELNTAYRRRFGFPFLYAVKGSTTREILDALERRISADDEEEFREALRQVSRIARFRLEDVIS